MSPWTTAEEKILKDRKPANCTYILRCADGSLYTGWTNDIEARLRAHNEGRGAKYTKSRRPVALAYLRIWETKQEAMSEEFRIKHLSRQEKLRLIREAENGERKTPAEETSAASLEAACEKL